MRTVWRYTLRVADGATTLRVPGGAAAVVAHVAAKSPEELTVWMEVDDDLPVGDARFAVTGTGHPAPERASRAGTAIAPLGLVWHLWRFDPDALWLESGF